MFGRKIYEDILADGVMGQAGKEGHGLLSGHKTTGELLNKMNKWGKKAPNQEEHKGSK